MRRVWRYGVWFAGVLLFVLSGMCAGAYIWLQRENSAADIARYIERLEPALQLQQVEGSILEPFTIGRLSFQTEAGLLQLESVRLAPDWSCLFYLHLCVDQLQVARLNWLPAQTKVAEHRTIELPRLLLPVALRVRDLSIDEARLGGISATPLQQVHARLYWLGERLSLQQLTLQWQAYQLSVQGRVSLREHYPLALQLAVAELQAGAAKPLANVNARGSLQQLKLQAQAPAYGGVSLRGRINLLDSRLPWVIEHASMADWYYQAPASVETELALTAIQASANGEGTQVQVQLQAQLASNWLVKAQPVSARLSLDTEGVVLQQLQVPVPEHGTLSAQGRMQWQESLNPQITLAWQNLLVNQWLPQLPQALRQSGQAQLSANIQGGELRQFRAEAVKSQGRYGDAASELTGTLSWQLSSGLTLESLQLNVGENVLHLRSPWLLGNTAQWQLEAQNLQQLWPELTGSVSGALQLQPLHPWRLGNIQLSASDLGYQALQIGRASLQGDIEENSRLALKARLANLSYRDYPLQTANIQLQGAWQQLELQLQAVAQPGRLAAGCDVRPAAGLLSLSCRSLQATPSSQLPVMQLENPVSIVASWQNAWQVRISPFCLIAGNARLCSDDESQLAADNWQADLRISRLPLRWLPGMQSAVLAIDGEVSGQLQCRTQQQRLQLQGQLGSDRVELQIQRDSKAYQLALLNPSVSLESDVKSITLQLNSVTSDNGKIAGELSILPGRQLQGQLQVQSLPLVSFLPLAEDIRQLQGQLDGELFVGGTLLQPQLRGELSVRDGVAEIIGLPWTLESLQLQTTFVGNHVTYQGQTRLGEGELTLNGELDWLTTLDKGQMHIRGRNIQLQPQARTNIWLNPDLQLDWQQNQVDIHGDILVPKAFVVLEEKPQGSVGVSSDSIVVAAEQPQDQPWQMSAAINVQLGEAVRFRGFGLESYVKGQLLVENSAQTNWHGRGVISLQQGSYRAYGQNLSIEKGELIFAGPLDDPVMRIEAVRDDIEAPTVVGVRAEGYLHEPVVTVFSNPAMAEQRALYYLLTGTAPEGEENADSQLLLNQAVLSYGLSKSESAVASLANKFGIYDIQLSAVQSEEGTRFQIGGYLHPRLQVRYGISSFDAVNELALRYRLHSNLFVEAVSGVVNSLDLLWSFRLNKR